MLPEPAAVQVPPPVPAQVHVQVRAAGKVSATVAPVAGVAVGFDAVMVYTTDEPGTAVVTPSLLVIDRSAGLTTEKQVVTSLTAGVAVMLVVERYALYLRYRLPLNWPRDAPLVVKNVAAVP